MYIFQQLRIASADELVQQVNRCVSLIGSSGGLDKIPLALDAQLFINELARRDQDRQTNTMLRHTRWMTVMTFAISLMTLTILFLTFRMVGK